MAKLKEIRTSRGVSQEELAELVGVSRQTVSKWESGDARPSADNLMRLSQVFQLPVEAFLRDDWKPPEQQAVEAAVILPEVPPEPDVDPEPPPAEAPPLAPTKARRWPVALICAGVVCALLLSIAALIGIYSIKQQLEPEVSTTPIEEAEIEGEEVNESAIIGTFTLYP